MKAEAIVLFSTLGLGLVHMFLPVLLCLKQHSIIALANSRDDFTPIESVMGQRAARANNNFKETQPWALALLVLVLAMGKTNGMSAMGAWIYLGARVLYIPLYLFGVPWLRTIMWVISLVGLAMIIPALLGPGQVHLW